MTNGSFPDINQMIKIDGSKIRRLRESKGLTQLYLATYVGVTTDTVSRWENRRYQTIKQGNAVKLTEALEVELDAILDTEGTEAEPPVPPAEPETVKLPEATPLHRRKAMQAVGLIAVFLLLLTTAGYFLIRKPAQVVPIPPAITAERMFPAHCAPNELLPVVIRIKTAATAPLSLIIREELPAGLQAVKATPDFTAVDNQGRSVKWLIKLREKEATISYLCRAPGEAPLNHRLYFSGTVTGKDTAPLVIEPRDAFLEIAPFHWADTNEDLKISDEEILSVYDHYSQFEGMGIDFSLIEDIWSANGYSWDASTKRFKAARQ